MDSQSKIDYSKLELTGLPNSYFSQNRDRYLINMRNCKNVNYNSIFVFQGAVNKPLYDTDQSMFYFCQESNFFYLSGVREEGILAILDLKTGKLTLFYQEPSEDSGIWEKVVTKEDLAKKYEVDVQDLSNVYEFIKTRDPQNILLLEGTGDYTQLPILKPDLEFKDSYAYLNDRVLHDPLYYNILKETRAIKAEYEIDLMRFINSITIDAHLQMMANIRPGQYERDMEMLFFNYLYKNYYTRIWAYPCIGGGNKNSATLHYEVNDRILGDGNLFLADMGIRFCNYTSDVTMTIPINGKFTKKQKEIYDIVLKSNRECQKTIKPGLIYYDIDRLSKIVILQELQKLGMLKPGFSVEEMFNNDIHTLFMAHGLGHYLGLDVHDVGHAVKDKKSLIFKENMVYTVEPGIYFVEFVLNNAFNDPKKNKYLNVDMIKGYLDFGGVRIEDDVVITKTGCINLTASLPRTTEEIEDFMRKNNKFLKEKNTK